MNNQVYNYWEHSIEINATKIKLLTLEIEQLKNKIKEIENITNHQYYNINHPYITYNSDPNITNEVVYDESDYSNTYSATFDESNFSTTYEISEENIYLETIDSETIDKKITIKKLREISEICKSTQNMLCPICKAEVKKGDIIRKLNCNHLYHPNCIDEWFDDNTNCPTCMKEFV